jgi:hypothetical protein
MNLPGDLFNVLESRETEKCGSTRMARGRSDES